MLCPNISGKCLDFFQTTGHQKHFYGSGEPGLKEELFHTFQQNVTKFDLLHEHHKDLDVEHLADHQLHKLQLLSSQQSFAQAEQDTTTGGQVEPYEQ